MDRPKLRPRSGACPRGARSPSFVCLGSSGDGGRDDEHASEQRRAAEKHGPAPVLSNHGAVAVVCGLCRHARQAGRHDGESHGRREPSARESERASPRKTRARSTSTFCCRCGFGRVECVASKHDGQTTLGRHAASSVRAQSLTESDFSECVRRKCRPLSDDPFAKRILSPIKSRHDATERRETDGEKKTP